MNLCACGCGEEIEEKINYHTGKILQFIHGHNHKGKKHSQETINKISQSKLGNKNPRFGKTGTMLGKKHSKESLEKMSNSHLEYKPTAETLIKRSMALKGKRAWNKGLTKENHPSLMNLSKSNTGKIGFWRNKNRNEETKIKISKTNIKKGNEWRLKIIMPLKDTTIELKLQSFLKKLQIEYVPHKVVNINHRYQCDLFIPSKALIIECDGNYWHNYPNGRDIDHIRTKELQDAGFKVLRLWEHQIKSFSLEEFEIVLNGTCG